MTVELSVTPHEQKYLLVIGTSLRKSKTILDAYLRSLDWQILPRNVEPFFCFVDDGLEPDAKTTVLEFLKTHRGELLPSGLPTAQDFSDAHPVTHQWTDTAMQRVGRNKDGILARARHNRAEAVWLCDSDLICDPMTLSSLWSIPDQIVCAVYWTRWQKVPSEANPVHAGPQVWQTHPYGLAGNGMHEWELRRKLVNRQIVPVLGQGACTLIRGGDRLSALQRGVSFAPMPGNTGPGLMQGEDRHFCLRAEQMHIRMVADGWPDIFHIYHRPEDEELIPEMLARLGQPPFVFPAGGGLPEQGYDFANPCIGHLVSLELCPLEPPFQGGPHVPAQYVRGRVGKLGLQPELEDAVLDMERGETRIVPVHFGLDYPPFQWIDRMVSYGGQRRLMRIRLIDHKPMGFPPVIDQEILRNTAGSWVDTTTLTPEAIDLMREVHVQA